MSKQGTVAKHTSKATLERRKMAAADWHAGTRSLTILASRYDIDAGKLGAWMCDNGHATMEELDPWYYLINKDISAATNDHLIPTDQYNG